MSTPQGWYYESVKADILQRYWHRRRFIEVGKYITPINGKVLDVGCADGLFSEIILDKSRATQLIGIDVEVSSIEWARKHWRKNPKMFFKPGDAHKLAFRNASFAAVVALEVLEHVNDPLRVLREIHQVLQPGGYAVLLVPTDNWLFRTIWWLWLSFYPRGYVWRETHIQTYSRDYLPKLCRRAGFIIEANAKFLLGMLQIVKVRK